MTWEQFTDVLPILTLILGYGGSRLSDRWREDKDRERIMVQRAAEVDGEALLELQDLFVRMPAKWGEAVDYINAAVRAQIDPPPHEAYAMSANCAELYVLEWDSVSTTRCAASCLAVIVAASAGRGTATTDSIATSTVAPINRLSALKRGGVSAEG
jgi:hypothetical protein